MFVCFANNFSFTFFFIRKINYRFPCFFITIVIVACVVAFISSLLSDNTLWPFITLLFADDYDFLHLITQFFLLLIATAFHFKHFLFLPANHFNYALNRQFLLVFSNVQRKAFFLLFIYLPLLTGMMGILDVSSLLQLELLKWINRKILDWIFGKVG